MSEIKISIRSDVERANAKVLARLNNLKPFWDKQALPLLFQEFERMFETEGYGTWHPLSERYRARKAILYPNKTILRRTDVLYGALTRLNAIRNYYISHNNFMEFGLTGNVEYARYHEYGTNNMPMRPIFSLIASYGQLKDKIERALIKGLEEWTNV